MKKLAKKPVMIAAVVILTAALLVGWVAVKKNAAAKSAAGAQYTAAKVTKGNIEINVDGSGSITPGDTATVKAKLNGTAEQVLITEGQQVTKGDTILILDGQTGADEIELARINLEIEESSLNDLLTNQGELKITAPASGVIGSIDAEVGDELSQGSSLASVIDKGQMEVTCSLNKSQAALVKKGAAATVLISDMMQTVSGKVTKVGTSGSAGGDGAVFYDVQVLVTNPGGLSEGMLTQTTIRTATGSVSAIGESELKWHVDDGIKIPVSGELTKLYVSSGDKVKKGQLIAVLESNDLATQIKKQRLSVQQKRLQLEQTISDTSGNVITAPISGTVMTIEVTEGDDLSASTTIATISDYSALKVVVPVDELDISKVKLGQTATVTCDAVSGTKFMAEVSDIAKEGVSTSGVSTFDVTLTMLDKEGLMAGMTVDAQIFIESQDDVMLIPIGALKQMGDKNFVLVSPDGTTDAAKAKRTEIEIGLSTADDVEVTKGLSAGDAVLVPVSTASTQSNNSMMPFGGGGPPSGTGQRSGSSSGGQSRGQN